VEHAVEQNKDQKPGKKPKDDSNFGYYFVSCFFLACGSVSFYKRATQRKLLWTITFFVFFGLLSSLLFTGFLFKDSSQTRQELVQGYDTGEIPTITIEHGIASAEGTQPWVSEADESVFIVDTTNQLSASDLYEYEEYILLRRNEIQILSDGRYQSVDLELINDDIADPIVIGKNFMLNFWRISFLFAELLIFTALAFWFIVVRFMYIAGIALILWGIRQIKRKDIGYKSILIIGLLANVPTIYIKNALSPFGISFFTFYTLLLLLIWIIMMVKVFKKEENFEPDRLPVESS
jgi:hypothetical protein